MNKKGFLILVLIMMLVLQSMVFAIGQDEVQNEGPITMRFSWWGGDARHQATLKAIDVYMAKNPNVKIEAEYGGFSSYYEKLVTQLAGNTAPDIIQIDYKWVHELASQGKFFVDMNKVGKAIDTSGFDSNFLGSYCSDGDYLLGLPAGVSALVLCTNEDLLKEAGIASDIDWNWDNLMEAGKKFHSENPKEYLFVIQPQQFVYLVKIMLQQINGNTLIKDDNSLGFSKDEMIEIYSYIKAGIDNGLFPPFEEIVLFDNVGWEQNPSWLAGKYGFSSNWAAGIPLSVKACDFAVGVNRFPISSDAVTPGLLVTPSTIISVNEASDYKDEALAFVNWFFNDAEAIAILGDSRGVPTTDKARTILAEQNILNPLVSKGTEMSVPFSGKADNAQSLNSEVTALLKESILSVGYGKVSVPKAVETLMEDLNDIIARL
jgi:oligogalacturonide transport system substrate-binding protein